MPTAVVEVEEADWVVVPVGRRPRHEDLTVAGTTMGLIKIPQAARCRLRLEAGIKEKQAGKPIRKGPMLPRFPTALSRRGSPTIEVLRNEMEPEWGVPDETVRHISFDAGPDEWRHYLINATDTNRVLIDRILGSRITETFGTRCG